MQNDGLLSELTCLIAWQNLTNCCLVCKYHQLHIDWKYELLLLAPFDLCLSSYTTFSGWQWFTVPLKSEVHLTNISQYISRPTVSSSGDREECVCRFTIFWTHLHNTITPQHSYTTLYPLNTITQHYTSWTRLHNSIPPEHNYTTLYFLNTITQKYTSWTQLHNTIPPEHNYTTLYLLNTITQHYTSWTQLRITIPPALSSFFFLLCFNFSLCTIYFSFPCSCCTICLCYCHIFF